MHIETVPLLAGVALLLVGAAFGWDAWGAEHLSPMRERRRRPRAGIDALGEGLVAAGTIAVAIALLGRDWRFETPAVLFGTILVIWGAVRNRQYIREALLFRGRARRGLPQPVAKRGKLRIR